MTYFLVGLSRYEWVFESMLNKIITKEDIYKYMKTIKKKEAFVLNVHNYVLKRKGYFISYNPSPYIPTLGSLRIDETALVIGNVYLILMGDHRKQYLKLKTKKECIEYFKKKEKRYSSYWSNPISDLKRKSK